MSMKLTHKTEILPTPTPTTEAQRSAALQELAECRELLRIPSDLYSSPRMRRRHKEAQAAVDSFAA